MTIVVFLAMTLLLYGEITSEFCEYWMCYSLDNYNTSDCNKNSGHRGSPVHMGRIPMKFDSSIHSLATGSKSLHNQDIKLDSSIHLATGLKFRTIKHNLTPS